jgi:hypothetical protein
MCVGILFRLCVCSALENLVLVPSTFVVLLTGFWSVCPCCCTHRDYVCWAEKVVIQAEGVSVGSCTAHLSGLFLIDNSVVLITRWR